MDIGFTGKVVLVLKKAIDDEEPLRIFAMIERINEAGITATYEDDEEEKHRYFIPFSNIRAIEEWTDEPEETTETTTSYSETSGSV